MQERKRTWKNCKLTASPIFVPPKQISNINEEEVEYLSTAMKNKGAKIIPSSITVEQIRGTGRLRDGGTKAHKNEKNNKKATKSFSKYQNKTGKTSIYQEEKNMRTDDKSGTFHIRRSKLYKCVRSPESLKRMPSLDYQQGDCIRKTTKTTKDHTKIQKNESTITTKKDKGKSSILKPESHSLVSATMKQRKEEIDDTLAFQKSKEVKKFNEIVEHYSDEQLSNLIKQEQAMLEEHKNQNESEELSKVETEYEFRDSTAFKSAKFFIFGGIDPFNPKSSTNHQQDLVNNGQKVLTYDFRQNVWTNIAVMPYSKHHHSAVVCNGLIYIIGGVKQLKDNHNPVFSKSMWSFNPLNSEWRSETSMPFARGDFTAIAHQKGIYVIGGQDSDKKVISSTIFYNVITKTWEQKAALNIPRCGLMGISFTLKNDKIVSDSLPHNDMSYTAKAKASESNDGKKIWAAGGLTNLTNSMITNIIEEYDVNLNVWTIVSRLRIPRCFGKMCLVNNEIYVVGGLAITNEYRSSLNAIDRYIFEMKSWTLAGKMKLSRHGHDVVYSNSKLFIIGGVSTVGPTSFYSIECFDTRTKKFLNGFATLPEPLSGLAAVRIDY